MEKVRFQICAKLPALGKNIPVGNQVIEINVAGLTTRKALEKAVETARQLLFSDAEILVEALEDNEKFDPLLFHNKKENLKPITFI